MVGVSQLEAILVLIRSFLAFWSPFITAIAFLIGFPTVIATYYEAFKTRQEARSAREGTLHSNNCLEFVTLDGTCINLVPLETLHSFPRVGDVILLPGGGMGGSAEFLPSAYLVESIEHIYTPVTWKSTRPLEARLSKAVAKVTSLNPAIAV
jgi:hypothetical protein